MTILQEAELLSEQVRQGDYGHPSEDFARISKMWEAILGVSVPVWKVPLCMIAVKISRQVNKRKRDNLVDIAGYANTANMVEVGKGQK